MKIVHVIASLGMGGAETLLAQITKRQAQDGHDVHIVCLLPKMVVPIDQKVTVHLLVRSNASIQMALLLPRLACKLSSLRPNIVHAHMLHSNLLTRLVRPILRIPILINTVHSAYETSNVLFRAGYRLLDRLVDVTVFVSHEAQDRYVTEKLTPDTKLAVVLNGIDTEYFKRNINARKRIRLEFGISDECVLMTAIGRLAQQKDYPTLFAAFSRVVDHMPNARLLIVGEGPLRAPLAQEVTALGLTTRVTFAGIRTDIPAILSGSDLLVLSSAWEGFGLVLAEAMACMVPVVSTDCGGTAEVVGRCGRLVPIGDSSALSSSIVEIIGMPPEMRQQMLELARERVCQNCSIEQTVANWYRIYRGEYSPCAD